MLGWVRGPYGVPGDPATAVFQLTSFFRPWNKGARSTSAMPLPLFPSETARPIMQYVRDLESKVRVLRNELLFRQWSMFIAGLCLGVAAEYLIMRYLVR